MWPYWFPDDSTDKVPGWQQPDPNLDRLLMAALCAAAALFIASLMPPPLVAVVLSEAFYWGAIGSLLAAALREEPVWAAALTAWDQAAMLMALSIIAGWFVDPDAAEAALAALAGTGT